MDARVPDDGTLFNATSFFSAALVRGCPTASSVAVKNHTTENAIIAPPEMPPELVVRWQQVFATAFRSAEVTNMIRDQGVVPLGQGAEVFAERIRADLQRVGPMIQNAGIKLE